MTDAKEIAIKAFWAGLPGIYGVDECLCEAIDAYEEARAPRFAEDDESLVNRAIATHDPSLRTSIGEAPRTISSEEFDRVVDAIAHEMFKSSVRGSKVENAAHSVLKTLGITVEK